MPILDNLKINSTFLSKSVPKFAKCAQRCNGLCQFIGELPFADISGVKIFGMCCVQAANLVAKLNKKLFSRLSDKLTGQVMSNSSKLSKFVTPDELEFASSIPDVTVSIKDLKQQEKDGFSELKEDFKSVKSKLSSMEDMLMKLHHLPGCTIITRSYKALMDALDRDFWAHTFQSYLAEFETSLGDYTVENLTQLFEKVYLGQCENSWDQLYKTFNHLWTCRSMYFYLKTTFFRHLPSSAPFLDLEQHVLHEMNLYERDVQIIQDAAEKITGGFFLSGLTSDKSWNLQLAYIPRFEDIDKTGQNLLMETTRGVIFGNAIVDKQKVYKHENSEFVRIQDISDNTEYIYRFKDNFVQPGIYRVFFPNGNTCIGYRYLPREGGIDQYYRLFRFPSGNIYYDHEIHRNSKWESITRFRFDHTNLSWKKIK